MIIQQAAAIGDECLLICIFITLKTAKKYKNQDN